MLQHWKVDTELECGQQVKAVRLDNAPELIATIRDWGRSSGVQLEATVPYTSS